MQDIRIAAVSMNGRLGEPEAVLSEIADWTAKAVAEGAELIFFPELVVHGHCTPNTYELAEAVPDGPSTRRLCQIAREYTRISTLVSVRLTFRLPRTPLSMRVGQHSRR